MTIQQVLSLARGIFAASAIEDSALECELLLMAALNIDRAQLYSQPNRALKPEEEERFWGLVERRLGGEPIAYIVGRREFYGLDFYVNPNVLIPRPESELLVEKALELAQNCPAPILAEIGTGCGAIAISLALSLPQAKIYATDISAASLKVALANCQKHGLVNRICFLEGDLLEPLPEPVDFLVANLPYVRESELPQLNMVNFEPSLALNGGTDGLEKIRKLSAQIRDKLRPEGCLLLEIGEGQAEAVTTFLHNLLSSAEIEVLPDLSGIERVVSLTLVP